MATANTTELTLEEIQAAMNGDELSQIAVYNKCKHEVILVCTRMMKELKNSAEDPEDLAQLTFVQIFSNLNTFEGRSQFKTWIHRIAVNQVLMHLRKNHVKKEIAMNGEEKYYALKVVQKPLPMEILIDLKTMISRLPADYKDVITRHDIEGLGHDIIAKKLGYSLSTSKSRLRKAREKVRSLMNMENDPAFS